VAACGIGSARPVQVVKGYRRAVNDGEVLMLSGPPAAGLLRLGLQKLMRQLGEPGEHINDDTVSKIDVSTNTVTATVAVGYYPYGVGFDGFNIWVANLLDDTVSKIVP
jgi:YVTN family beta-propeller protein